MFLQPEAEEEIVPCSGFFAEGVASVVVGAVEVGALR